ncbi:molybdate ABC transporter permease subunit [Secundilactobacillus kimchicus]|nr:molybdate ABC transporter permease subunit [Secundilactobacillus kimchicus]
MPIIHSMTIATCATIIAFFIALPISFSLSNKRGIYKTIVEIVITLPMVLPPTVIGLVLLNTLGRNSGLGAFLWDRFNFSVIFTLTGAVIATTIVVLPIMYQGVKSAFLTIDQSLIDVAKTLSATPLQRFFRIILPNCWPVMLSGILLSFCRALGEFGATLMVAGYIQNKTDTISTSIYFLIQDGRTQMAVYLAVVNLFIGLVALLVIQLLGKKDVINK